MSHEIRCREIYTLINGVNQFLHVFPEILSDLEKNSTWNEKVASVILQVILQIIANISLYIINFYSSIASDYIYIFLRKEKNNSHALPKLIVLETRVSNLIIDL